MANTTKQLIAEQVLYRLNGGYIDINSPVQYEDIYKATEQIVNAQFKVKHFDTTLPSGETIIDNLALATYENVAVTAYGEKARATLPVMPISLPKGMGVYAVYSDAQPDVQFIPLQAGQSTLLRADKMLNNLLGQIGYELKGNKVVFTKDITLLDIDTVTMELAVMDISQYDTDDILPIPSDFEAELIEQLVKMFAPVQPEAGDVSAYNSKKPINQK